MGYLFLIGMAFIPAFILTKIIVFIHAVAIAPFRRNKIVENGEYKTIEGEKIGDKSDIADEHGNYLYIFKYYVDGKKYITNVNSHTPIFNDNIPFFYHKNPSNAYASINNLGGIEYPSRITAILTAIFSIILIAVVKFNQ